MRATQLIIKSLPRRTYLSPLSSPFVTTTMFQQTPTSLLGTLGFMGNPSTAIRQQAGGGSLFNGGTSMSRDVRPLAADPTSSTYQIGDAVSADNAIDMNSASSAVIFRTDSQIDKNTLDQTTTATHVWGDPHFVTSLVYKDTYDKNGNVIKHELVTNLTQEGLTADQIKTLENSNSHTVSIDKDARDANGNFVTVSDWSSKRDFTYTMSEQEFTHHGAPGEVYKLFEGDNLRVSGLYGQSPWSSDGTDPTVIVATKIASQAGQIFYDKTDPDHYKVSTDDGRTWVTKDINQITKFADGTVVGPAAANNQGETGLQVVSNLGHAMAIYNEERQTDWTGKVRVGAQTVAIEGIGASGGDGATHKAQWDTQSFSKQDSGTGFRNVDGDDGILSFLAKNDITHMSNFKYGNKTFDLSNTDYNAQNGMEGFAKAKYMVKAGDGLDIPLKMYKGDVNQPWK